MFWWITYKNILDYLEFSTDSNEQKEKIISRNIKSISSKINKLDVDKIIHYLLDVDLPLSVRKLINDKINELYSKKDSIMLKLVANRTFSIEELYHLHTNYPNNDFIDKIIKESTFDSPYKNILDENIPFEYKKMYIDVYKQDFRILCNILKVTKDKEVISYVIDSHDYSTQVIASMLFDLEVDSKIKKEILKRQINTDNIIGVLSSPLTANKEIRKEIVETKYPELVLAVLKLNKQEISSMIRYDSHNHETIDLIIRNRRETLEEAIKEIKIENLFSSIINCSHKPLADLIIEIRKNDLGLAVEKIKYQNLANILASITIPQEYKEIILKNRSEQLGKDISKLHISTILSYLRCPDIEESIKKLFFDLRFNDIVNEITDFSFYQVLGYYFDENCYGELNKLIVKLCVSSTNIFRILNSQYLKKEKCIHLINEKNNLIAEMLNNMQLVDLMVIRTEPDIPMDFKEIIVENNKELIRKRLTESIGLSFALASNLKEVPHSIKEMVIEELKLNKDEVDNIFILSKYCNRDILLKKYNELKEYISSLGIDFSSFLQYGAGSTKYKNWFNSINNILVRNKKEEFKTVKEYFFKNYYNSSKDSTINTIENFLEILTNFDKYYDLFMYFATNNYILSKEEKENISFLFSNEQSITIEEPKDLSEARNELCEQYKRMINKEDLTLNEIKEMFNSILFCGSNKIINRIGGTLGLAKLKSMNSNSKTMVDYINVLMEYVSLIELVNLSTNTEGLRRAFKSLLDNNMEEFIKMQSEDNKLSERIKKLYELDSQINLTKIDKVRNMKSVYDEKLSKKYGTTTLDFSDKNYALYAHILSDRENMEDLIKGRATGDKNFISLSPISYLGQKYYYGINYKVTFAYDTIPDGNFICSSRENMGSNDLINQNSSEVKERENEQLGILDTSAVTRNNAEALLYREGLKPSGIILVGGRKPTDEEISISIKYNLPLIITQEKDSKVKNARNIFGINEEYQTKIKHNPKVREMFEIVNKKINIQKENNEYTGREIALFTDSHGMYEPTLAILEDIKKRGIKEIYSLGDNVGLGPNPDLVHDLLQEYSVKSICGNSEYYNILGISPFTYFNKEKDENQRWTMDKLGSQRIKEMRKWNPSLDLEVGTKKIGLCHFLNDIRWDYSKRSTWTYQENFIPGFSSKQFDYTNSEQAKKDLEKLLSDDNKGKIKAAQDVMKNPLLNGKRVNEYDAIIQGHTHFDIQDHLNNTDIYTLRAAGMGYKNDMKNTACYYILREKTDGTFDIEKKLVVFDRSLLLSKIDSSTLPHKSIILRMVK